MRRSRTSCATSGWRELTPYAYLVRSAAMFRVVNWASTCETRALGHSEPVRRSLMLTAEMTGGGGGGVACAAE